MDSSIRELYCRDNTLVRNVHRTIRLLLFIIIEKHYFFLLAIGKILKTIPIIVQGQISQNLSHT